MQLSAQVYPSSFVHRLRLNAYDYAGRNYGVQYNHCVHGDAHSHCETDTDTLHRYHHDGDIVLPTSTQKSSKSAQRNMTANVVSFLERKSTTFCR